MGSVNVTVTQGVEVATLSNGFSYVVPLKVITGDSSGILAIRDPDTLAIESSNDVGGVISGLVFTDGFIYAIHDGKIRKYSPDDLTTEVAVSSVSVRSSPLAADSVGNLYAITSINDLVQFDQDLVETGRNTVAGNTVNGVAASADAVFWGGFNDALWRADISDISVTTHTLPAASTDIEAVALGSDGSVLVSGRSTTLRRFLPADLTAAGTATLASWGTAIAGDPSGNVYVTRGGSFNESRVFRLSDMFQLSALGEWGSKTPTFADSGTMYGSSTANSRLVKYSMDPLTRASEVTMSSGVCTINRNISREILGLT